ncbi:uncharacterized protein LOC124170364 [Ischnura elegans]|uniref:uncharacterized protein LOC124170364 n=1 Tax=Ischnura elegans TaxID=197161 RepID=UPI001ED89B06|nr:uncharacterized protein LOC124170364 [Ischnura elegans]
MVGVRVEVTVRVCCFSVHHIDRITNESASRTYSSSTSKQKKKFQHLHERQHPQPPNNKEKLICNIAGIQLSDAATSVLAKGLNFAFSPRHIPVEDIITGVEVALRKLPHQDAEEIRQDVANVLTKSKPPRPNLPLDQRRALDDLKSNRDIIILGADKGNSTVVINRKDYQAKVKSLLEDPTYEKLKKDPTAKIEREVRELIKRSSISNEEQFQILPSSARPPRLYGLPKIHKEGVPFRPIVSCIGSPTYALARYLANHLQPFIGQTGSCVKNSKEFIEVLKQLRIADNDILVSFDVVSLFTKVPIKESVDIIKRLTKFGLPTDFPKLADFCLRSNYFLWDGEFYKQKDGAAMGSPLSPVVANLYMEHFEEDALASSKLRPSCWIRYVDDTFVIWPHGKDTLKEFADHLNSIHPSIQFTMEIEMNGELPFLDGTVDACYKAATLTSNQSKYSLWEKLRFSRVTASKIYDVANCKTVTGSLEETLLGGSVFTTDAIKRGVELEPEVILEAERRLKVKVARVGLLLSPSLPILSAFPDGLMDHAIIEVKCPSSSKYLKIYVSDSGVIAPKYMGKM